MRIKQFSTVAGGDFDKFLTAFCKIQEAVRVGPYRTGLSPYPAWIGFICQPTAFPKEFWIVEDNLGRAIGRIGANLLLGSEPHSGAIGFFETDLKHPEAEKAGHALLEAAEAWLKSKGASKAYGPMNFNSWHQYRFGLPESMGLPLFNWEPIHPPEYVGIWQSAGYTSAAEYVSRARANLQALADKTKLVYESCAQAGFSFRPVDRLKNFDADLKSIFEIGESSAKDAIPREPISLEVFRGLHVSLSGKGDCSFMAFDKSGQAAGFILMIEDQGYAVFKGSGVRAEFAAAGLDQALVHEAAQCGLKRGLSNSVTALEPVGRSVETSGTELWSRRYALFQKSLV